MGTTPKQELQCGSSHLPEAAGGSGPRLRGGEFVKPGVAAIASGLG